MTARGGYALLAQVNETLERLTRLEHEIHTRRTHLRGISSWLRTGGCPDVAAARIVAATREDSMLAELDTLEDTP